MDRPRSPKLWCIAAAVVAAAAGVSSRSAVHAQAPNAASPDAASPGTPASSAKGPAAAEWRWAPDAVGGYSSDHIMVKLAPGAKLSVDHTGAVTARDSKGVHDASVARALASARATSAAKAWAMPPANTAQASALGMDRWVRVSVPAGTDTPALVQQLMDAARARAAGSAASGAAGGAAGGSAATIQVAELDAIGGVAVDAPTPNDPQFANLWGMENTGQQVNGVFGTSGSDIKARAAWHVTTGRAQTVIAVLDSGVNLHQEYASRVLSGWNVPQLSTVTTDACASHGTHVTGTLAARGSNGLDVTGLDWNCKILPVVVVNPCSGQSSWLADGITWAVDHGATVINMSLQYSVGPQYLYDAVLYATNAHVPLVAAAGNNTGILGVAWPAKFAEVIAVGSLQSNDSAASSSAVGPELEVAAPGVDVLSTTNLAGAEFKNGTSMACPHVAGTIALMRSVAPTLSFAQLRTILHSTAVDVQSPGVDQSSGYGRINAGAAVRAARNMAGLGDLNVDGKIDGADLGALLGAWGNCGTPCPADLNDDGLVDGADLGILLGNWSVLE